MSQNSYRSLYIDTRATHGEPVSFSEAIVLGLANGGGLFVPETLPHFSLDEIMEFAPLPYASRAAKIYEAFGVDLPQELIQSSMEEAYGDNFDSEDVCPITSLDAKTHLLELWHGPTSAFKDMALQCLPHFFLASAAKLAGEGNLAHDFLILVATSGDTGKAALEGFKNIEGVKVAVLYPHNGVSDIQYKQMATQEGNNVAVWAVEGNFDDCQMAVKTIFSDEAFKAQLLKQYRVALSSANSINWGRLLPQIVYYVSSYATLVKDGKLRSGDLLDVCVPTGNFGNILAAWYAKAIGTPLGMLYCASNENRVLTDFINTGSYDISNRDFMLTPSPSMDILVSSNLERQLFEMTGRNPEAIRTWMTELRDKKAFRVDAETFANLREHFASDSVDNKACLTTIKQVFEKHNYLIDPHTAVAYHVAENLRGENPVLIVATAHWAKFAENVYRALHEIAPDGALPGEVKHLTGSELGALIAHETACYNIPDGLAKLDTASIRFSDVVEKEPSIIEATIEQFLKQR